MSWKKMFGIVTRFTDKIVNKNLIRITSQITQFEIKITVVIIY